MLVDSNVCEHGKVVVVTGGGSGIGAALCATFARAGARAVVCADIDLSHAEEVCRSQPKLRPFFVDAASGASVAKLVEWTEREVSRARSLRLRGFGKHYVGIF